MAHNVKIGLMPILSKAIVQTKSVVYAHIPITVHACTVEVRARGL